MAALYEKPEIKDALGEALKNLFGLDYLFPYQRLVISNILEAAETCEKPESKESDRQNMGRQIVILPTGAGKSLCFQFPAMLLSGPTLVIYPILSLMADQERRLNERGFKPVLLRGGQSAEERKNIWKKLESGESRFIIANPEVLLTAKVMEKLPLLGIVHLVIDEAHCVSEWGESFRPSYLRIAEIIKAIKGDKGQGEGPIITAFTATASSLVLEKIDKYIFCADESAQDYAPAQRIVGNPDRSNIYYSSSGVLLRDIAVRDYLAINQRPAIVFCSSRPGTEKLARYLRNSFEDKEIRFYHAGLSKEEKTAVEKWFFPNPHAILVSTCAYGMGVDKPDIRTVIHRDCPPSVEAYLQESGRAGRDGKASKAILLWGPDDEKRLRLAGTLEADAVGSNTRTAEMARKRLRDLLHYARNTSSCRRDQLIDLLNYEGPKDSPGEACCDVCSSNGTGHNKASKYYREENAIVDFIRRNKRAYTTNEAARLISKAENLGLGEKEAGELLNLMVFIKKLHKSKNIFYKNKLTLQGQARCRPLQHHQQ